MLTNETQFGRLMSRQRHSRAGVWAPLPCASEATRIYAHPLPFMPACLAETEG